MPKQADWSKPGAITVELAPQTEDYEVTTPDGRTVTVTGPKGASDAEIAQATHNLLRDEDAKVRNTPLGTLDTAVRGIDKGALFNFDDEIVSALNAVVPLDKITGNDVQSIWDGKSFSEAFHHNMQQEQRVAEADSEANPVVKGLSTLAGAVGGGIGSARAVGAGLRGLAATRRAQQVGQALRTIPGATTAARVIGSPVGGATLGGAAGGAVAGAGEGDTLENRAQSAGTGATIGGALGFGIGSAVAGLAPVISRYLAAWRGRDIPQSALEQMYRALARDGYDVVTPQGRQALEIEISRFAGKPVSLADVGAATRARAGVGLRSQSPAQQQAIDTVINRQQGQAERLVSDITDTVAPRTDVHAIDDNLIESRNLAALPARREAMYENVPIQADNDVGTSVSSPEIPSGLNIREPTSEEKLGLGVAGRTTAVGTPNGNGRIVAFIQDSTVSPPTMKVVVELENGTRQTFPVSKLTNAEAPQIDVGPRERIADDHILQNLARHPMAQRALEGARDLSAAERLTLEAQGLPTDHLAEFPTRGGQLTYKQLDAMKRYMDDEIGRAFAGQGSFTKAEATQLKQLRDAIRQRMRDTNPEYAQYLDTYGDAQEMRDALWAGRGGPRPDGRGNEPGFNQLDPEVIAAQQAERSQAGREFYRVGAARNLVDQVNNVRDTGTSIAADRIMNSPTSRARVRALGLSEADFARMEEAVRQERQLSRLTGELRGSQTDARLAARQDAQAHDLPHQLPFNPASGVSWAGSLLRRIIGNVNLARNEAINAELLPRILSQDPQVIRAIIDELEQAGNVRAARQIRDAARARTSGTTAGVVIGAPVATKEGYN